MRSADAGQQTTHDSLTWEIEPGLGVGPFKLDSTLYQCMRWISANWVKDSVEIHVLERKASCEAESAVFKAFLATRDPAPAVVVVLGHEEIILVFDGIYNLLNIIIVNGSAKGIESSATGPAAGSFHSKSDDSGTHSAKTCMPQSRSADEANPCLNHGSLRGSSASWHATNQSRSSGSTVEPPASRLFTLRGLPIAFSPIDTENDIILNVFRGRTVFTQQVACDPSLVNVNPPGGISLVYSDPGVDSPAVKREPSSPRGVLSKSFSSGVVTSSFFTKKCSLSGLAVYSSVFDSAFQAFINCLQALLGDSKNDKSLCLPTSIPLELSWSFSFKLFHFSRLGLPLIEEVTTRLKDETLAPRYISIGTDLQTVQQVINTCNCQFGPLFIARFAFLLALSCFSLNTETRELLENMLPLTHGAQLVHALPLGSIVARELLPLDLLRKIRLGNLNPLGATAGHQTVPTVNWYPKNGTLLLQPQGHQISFGMSYHALLTLLGQPDLIAVEDGDWAISIRKADQEENETIAPAIVEPKFVTGEEGCMDETATLGRNEFHCFYLEYGMEIGIECRSNRISRICVTGNCSIHSSLCCTERPRIAVTIENESDTLTMYLRALGFQLKVAFSNFSSPFAAMCESIQEYIGVGSPAVLISSAPNTSEKCDSLLPSGIDALPTKVPQNPIARGMGSCHANKKTASDGFPVHSRGVKVDLQLLTFDAFSEIFKLQEFTPFPGSCRLFESQSGRLIIDLSDSSEEASYIHRYTMVPAP